MKKIAFGLSIVFIIMLSACSKDYTKNKSNILFEIKNGESFRSVANRLKKKKIINSPSRLRVLAKLLKKDRAIQAGVYQITPKENYADLLNKFTTGKVFSIHITIPEGYNIYQIAQVVEKKGFCTEAEFLAECRKKSILDKYGIPSDSSLEGYLFPDTYFVPLNYTAKQIVKMMLDRFDVVVNSEMKAKIKQRGMNLHEVLTMASIIEKESSVEHEKPVISGVYNNRLKIGMKLQADPTLIYALMIDNKYDGDIKFRHFDYDSPYNTYKIFGMPSGPISSVGKTSILAAIFPAKVEYLYFVAMKPGGEHYFSRTLQEHNAAVQRYIKKRKK